MKLTIDNIEKISNLFLQYGIKSVSMDDIANNLGKSKKTLYQEVQDKNELVKEVIDFIKSKMLDIVKEYEMSDFNAIEKEIYHRKKYLKHYMNIKPTFLYDLRKFYAHVFEEFMSFKKELIMKTTQKIIEDGKEQGLFRQDIDSFFMAKLSVGLTFAAFHPEVDAITEDDITNKHFSNQFFIYHMNGICSEKGRKLFYQLIENDEFLNK